MRMVKSKLSIILALGLLFGISTIQAATGYFALTITNNTKIATNNQVYVLVKANTGTKDCFMQFDANGYGTCETVNSNTKSETFSYKLSELPSTIYLPKTISGRIYFSIGYPMDMFVDPNTLKIVNPDGFKPRDANYYTLYDKVEYSYTDAGTWMNPTAVDFFSIPIAISQPDSTSGATQAGLSESRSNIMQQIQGIFQSYDKTKNRIWNNLFLNYQNDDSTNTILRLVSPGKAMVSNIPDTTPFDQDYLANLTAYGFDYTSNLWNYYQNNTLVIDCSELKSIRPDIENFIFTGKVVGDKFIFTNGIPKDTVSIAKPEHSTPFFAGAGGSFDAENNTPKAIIIRQLTSAFEVGLLPAPDGTTIDKKYFSALKTSFYQHNKLLPPESTKQGPWYDLYSKALHSFGDKQPVYTFAYDDALGQDGTLHSPNANNPSASITLGDMTGITIPDPYTDNTIYTVTPIIGKGSTVTYNGQKLASNVPIYNVTIPFHVKLNGQDAYIYIKHPLVRPCFNGADGIVINKESDNSAQILFPGIN